MSVMSVLLQGKESILGDREVRYCCPYCGDTKFHLYLNSIKDVYHCFKCGAGGRVGSSRVLTLDHWRDFMNPPGSSASSMQTEPARILPFRSQCLTDDSHQPITALSKPEWRYWNYLLDRGLMVNEVIDNKLHYILNSDLSPFLTNAIVFPVFNPPTKVEYWTARSLDGSNHGWKPKYFSAAWPKGDTLYRPFTGGYMGAEVVCEGPFDAIRIARVAKVAALLGKHATDGQIRRLVKQNSAIIIMLDPETFSDSVLLKLSLLTAAEYLGKTIQVRIAWLQEKDPGEMTEDEIRDAIRQAQ